LAEIIALLKSQEKKSLAVEVTLSQDIMTLEQVQDVMTGLLDKLKYRLSKYEDKLIVKQGVKLKFSDFNQTTVEQRSDEVDVEVFSRLFQRAMLRANNRTIRLVGITLGFSPKKSLENGCEQLMLPIQ
jgi:DNA polymerase IV